jgi:hypothetical protein
MATTIQLAKASTLPPVGATLMKTGQTVSYRTGDDGDLEKGRATSFLVLASNNPFGNTNRFTDELGGTAYTNNIVIDWSTFDGSTVLGYYRLVYSDNSTWNTAIDLALTKTIGGFSSWKMCNRREAENIFNFGVTLSTILNYAPFNNAVNQNIWTSTTSPLNTANAYLFATLSGDFAGLLKTAGGPRYMVCRTFTVTGTTLS